MRHGETEWNRAGRWQGREDSPLTPKGEAQARAMGAMCARLGLVPPAYDLVASPQPRAARTAELAFGVRPQTDARLAEIDVGDWTGALSATLRAEAGLPGHLSDGGDLMALYELAPRGEGASGLLARVSPFVRGLTRPTILVTHGITGRAIRVVALGLASERMGHLTGGQGNAFRIVEGVETRLTPTAEDAPPA